MENQLTIHQYWLCAFFYSQTPPEKFPLFQVYTKQIGKTLSYPVQNQKGKKSLKRAESREQKTKDTVLYYILPNYLYALIINRENFTLFSLVTSNSDKK